MYTLEFAPQALEDLSTLKKSEPAAFKKAGKLLVELQEHPKTGSGKPEPLAGDRIGQWSRRISLKHRLMGLKGQAMVSTITNPKGAKPLWNTPFLSTTRIRKCYSII